MAPRSPLSMNIPNCRQNPLEHTPEKELLSKAARRFHTIDSVKRELGFPVFGKILRDRRAALNRTVLDCDRNHLDFAESFRNLRSSLLSFPEEHASKKCFAVTRALLHEGKSTIAVNLAIALAATNARVLLIGDLRHGKLCRLLKTESRQCGGGCSGKQRSAIQDEATVMFNHNSSDRHSCVIPQTQPSTFEGSITKPFTLA
jgi:hypothetical protein